MGRLALAAALWCAAIAASAETVVFNEGMGSGKRDFAKVIAALEPDTPVFFAPRPATMAGDKDGRRSPSDVARDLHARLAAAHVAPPYVMVGHSLGGSYALAFARLYPGEVTGLLLIDPRLVSFTRDCLAAGQQNCEIPPLILHLLPKVQQMEYGGLNDDAELLSDAAPLGDLPVVVLGATVASRGISASWQSFWLNRLAKFTATARNGRFVAVPDATHMIQNTRPDIVIREIRSLLR